MFAANREISKLVYTDMDSMAYQLNNAVRVLVICQCQSDVRKLIPNVMSVYRHMLICRYFDFHVHKYLGKTKIVINCHHHREIFFFSFHWMYLCVCVGAAEESV